MTTTVDQQRRIVLPSANPGDVFDVQVVGDGLYRVVRVDNAHRAPPMTREECLRALDHAPLQPGMSWPALRSITREP